MLLRTFFEHGNEDETDLLFIRYRASQSFPLKLIVGGGGGGLMQFLKAVSLELGHCHCYDLGSPVLQQQNV